MKTVTLIKGDGIGKEIAVSLEEVFEAMGAPINFEKVDAGYEHFLKTGEALTPDVYESIEKNKIAIKGPTTTQIASGFRSINVFLRKKYDLYSNVRRVRSFENTNARYENIDMMIFRENTEGLYVGEEDIKELENGEKVATAIKRITSTGSRRIIEEAFSYADKNNIDKVTIAHKANILKVSDGLFLEEGKKVAEKYPHIKLELVIIDNMCMQLVMNPHQFKVIVTMNFYGDLLSDLCAGLVGGLGLAPGSNIGKDVAIFEAVHGSAPDIAGLGVANPTALLLSAVDMLNYLDLTDYAKKLDNAIVKTYKENTNLTKDLGGTLTTKEFTNLVISNL